MHLCPPESATRKLYTHGTHRTVSPSETVARARPLLSRFGITRVANVTGLDELGIPVVLAVRPNSRSLSVSQGKGIDLDAAKASAIMESIEQHCAEHAALPTRWDSFEQLASRATVVDVETLPRLPRSCDPRTRILWTEATELRSGRSSWIPYELVHLDFTLPLPPGSGYFLGGSNGLASGNHPLEALTHGLLELIERDALSLFYRMSGASQSARRVEPDTIVDDSCRDLLGRYERASVAVGLWDATSDIGVPTFLCGIVDRETNPFRPLGLARGSGCHPDATIAISRALTEAAQSRLTRITGSRDDLQQADFDAHRAEASVAAHRSQIVEWQGPSVRREWPSASLPTFEDETRCLVDRLTAVGLTEVLYVDLSPTDSPFHVMRVVVPGLEGTAENPAYQPGKRARGLEITLGGEGVP